MLIHNASRPRRPHLWIRVLVCPWEAFAKQGEYEPGSIGIWSQHWSQMSPKWHPNPAKIPYKSHLGSPTGRFQAPGRKKTAHWQHMGAHGYQKGPTNRRFLCQVLSFSVYFSSLNPPTSGQRVRPCVGEVYLPPLPPLRWGVFGALWATP